MQNDLPTLFDTQDAPDEELIMRAVARDRDAFAMLYDRYAGKALGFATRIVGDQVLAEDVVQEAFWRVWHRAGTFDPSRASLSTWLMGIVHHCAVDELRRQHSRITPVEIEEADHETQLTRDMNTDVVELAWLRMACEQVRHALAQLPAAQRAVIELAFFAGFSRQEIAERLNEPLGTVHTRARLGMLKLKGMLAPLA